MGSTITRFHPLIGPRPPPPPPDLMLQGWHPLHVAAFYGRVDDVKKLLGEEEAYVEAIDANGRTPLHFARAERYRGCKQVAALLIAAGANDAGPTDKFGRSPHDVRMAYHRL